MNNVFKIAAITSCLVSFCYGNISAAEDSIAKEQKEVSNRVARMMEQSEQYQNWQAYTDVQETPRKPKHSNLEHNRKQGKQEVKGKAHMIEENNPFALYLLGKEIESDFRDIMDDRKNPQHSKLVRLIEDIMLEPWALNGEGQPEKLKGDYKGVKRCYSRRIDHKDRLVYTVSNGAVTILSCKGYHR